MVPVFEGAAVEVGPGHVPPTTQPPETHAHASAQHPPAASQSLLVAMLHGGGWLGGAKEAIGLAAVS